ncbi:hypothetical protein LXL04_020358 [Taraxacum kok-saghyz]
MLRRFPCTPSLHACFSARKRQMARRLLRFPSLYLPRFEFRIEREKSELKGTFGATTTAPRLIAIEDVSDSIDEVQGMHSDASTLRKASILREASRIKGNLVTIAHRLPYSSISFYAFERYKNVVDTKIVTCSREGSANIWTPKSRKSHVPIDMFQILFTSRKAKEWRRSPCVACCAGSSFDHKNESAISLYFQVVFAGYSAESLLQRIMDCKPKIVVTCNVVKRGKNVLNLKGYFRLFKYTDPRVPPPNVARIPPWRATHQLHVSKIDLSSNLRILKSRRGNDEETLHLEGNTRHCQERICVPIEEAVDEMNESERRTNASIATTFRSPPRSSERTKNVNKKDSKNIPNPKTMSRSSSINNTPKYVGPSNRGCKEQGDEVSSVLSPKLAALSR